HHILISSYLPGGGGDRAVSEVAATLLLALDGLEQRLEVALAEAQRPVPLDQLEEHGRAVAQRSGEDLQQVAVLVPVLQDVPRAHLPERDWELAGLRWKLVVGLVAVRGVEERHAARPQHVHRGQDVAGGQRDVLPSRRAVELEELVDLRLAS